MTDDLVRRVGAVHVLAQTLPRCDHMTSQRELPANGVYLYFERDERARWDGETLDRIVRIGTHRANGRLPVRIGNHYKPHKNASVFRKHLGGALLRRVTPRDPRLTPWLAQGGPSFQEVEREVSRVLRERFTYVCVCVPAPEDRDNIERRLIALLAQHQQAEPSAGWLGRSADAEEIGRTGMWNVQHVDAEPLAAADLGRFEQRVRHTLDRWGKHELCR